MSKTIRTTFLAILLVFSKSYSQEELDKIVAVVDDNIILKSELQQFAYSFAMQNKIDPLKEQDKFNAILQKTLDDMIIQKVLLVKAKEDSVEVSEKQINSVLENQINDMITQLGSEEKVEEYFGSSLRQIRREFREEVEERLLVQKLRETKSYETKISRREVELFFSTFRDSLPQLKEAVKISHILVKVEPSAEAVVAATKIAEEVLTRIEKGEDFGELAKQFSDDPGSAVRGGNLGLVQRGEFVKEFEEVAFNLEPGEISGIVQSQFGLHIIQLIKKLGEKINTRHILIGLKPTAEDEKRTAMILNDLRKQLVSKELTFEEAVEKYSKDETSKDKVGDLGWFEMEEFRIPAFKTAIVGLEPGEISDPTKTKFGLHLVRLDEKREKRSLDLKDDWEQIENWALERKRGKEFESYIALVKKEVYIELKGL